MALITPVQSKRDMRDFVRLPARLHANDPHFVPRLSLEMSEHLSAKNPYFLHAQTCFFLARDEAGRLKGRISAQIDALAQKPGKPVIGHFGLIEADDAATLRTLLNAAELWLSKHGAERAQGPYSLSINDESGLLVSGFDTRPRMMMNHAPQWYAQAIESNGYQKAKDLIAYDLAVSTPLPAAALCMAQAAERDSSIAERSLDMKNFAGDLSTILGIFNEAWADNWGFVPMTDAEMKHTASSMKPLINPKLARIASVNGKPAAMIVCLPDLNEAIEDLRGEILPFGWAKLLWRLKVKGLKSGRVLLMGVAKEYQGTPMGGALSALLMTRLQTAAHGAGMERLELSWILEDNAAMNRILLAFGATPYKHYRIFERDLRK